MGLIQATPGEMKSLRSSADKIALIVEKTQVVRYTGTDYEMLFGSSNIYGFSPTYSELSEAKSQSI